MTTRRKFLKCFVGALTAPMLPMLPAPGVAASSLVPEVYRDSFLEEFLFSNGYAQLTGDPDWAWDWTDKARAKGYDAHDRSDGTGFVVGDNLLTDYFAWVRENETIA